MYIGITYATALAFYPQAVAEVEKNLRRGKSKHKDANLEDLEWGYSWCVVIEGSGSFSNLVANFQKRTKAPTVEENEDNLVADYARRCGVVLEAKTPGKRPSRWYSNEKLVPVPEAILAPYREKLRADAKEKARLDSLTPEQRQKEIDDAIAELSKSPGFFVLR